MYVSVRDEFDALAGAIRGQLVDRLRFATARALTDTASAARQTVRDDMRRWFDRPTPFTVRGVYVERATTERLEAAVGILPLQAHYLRPQAEGGVRTAADYPGGKVALVLPGAVKLNRYGNIPAGTLARLAQQAAAAKARLAQQAEARRRAAAAVKGHGAAVLQKMARSKARLSGVVYIAGNSPQAHGKPGGYFRRLADGRLRRLTDFAASQEVRPRMPFDPTVEAVARRMFALALAERIAEGNRARR